MHQRQYDNGNSRRSISQSERGKNAANRDVRNDEDAVEMNAAKLLARDHRSRHVVQHTACSGHGQLLSGMERSKRRTVLVHTRETINR
jgi:hypothetical protein